MGIYLPLRHDRDVDDLYDELQLRNLHSFRSGNARSNIFFPYTIRLDTALMNGLRHALEQSFGTGCNSTLTYKILAGVKVVLAAGPLLPSGSK